MKKLLLIALSAFAFNAFAGVTANDDKHEKKEEKKDKKDEKKDEKHDDHHGDHGHK